MAVLMPGCKWLKAAQMLNLPSGPVLALAAEDDRRKDLDVFAVPGGAQFWLAQALRPGQQIVATVQFVHQGVHSHRIYLTRPTVLRALVRLVGPATPEGDEAWRPLVLRRGPQEGLPLCVTCRRVVAQAGQCNACYEMGRKIA